jgi:hypothetical protein
MGKGGSMKNIVIIMIIMVIVSCSCEDNQFVYNQDSTVTDKVTGLTWMSGGVKEKSFIEALYHAERMTKKTGKKWLVPTYEQWETIMDEKGIFKSPFNNVKTNTQYWTSNNIGRTISGKQVNFVIHTKLVIAKMVGTDKGMKAVDDLAYLLLVCNK